MPAYRIDRATAAQAALAVEILREAATWSLRLGQPTWNPDAFDVPTFESAASAGELILGYEYETPVACMLLMRKDDIYWPDDSPDEALYLHKIAIRRSVGGTGWPARLVCWAREDAERHGISCLRMDTIDRPKLLSLYTRLGFRVVDSYAEHWCGDAIVRLELRF